MAVHLDVAAGVLGEEDLVARLHVQLTYRSIFLNLAVADGNDQALLGLLLRRVGDHEAALRRLFARTWLNDHAVAQGAELLRGWHRGGLYGRLRGVGGLGFGGSSHGGAS